ncbi:hypothetical protein DPMN_013370 [Dreissena polymorpha]|uniref:EGF-like domain-containing protein n=1 Tax=Dreissena polymorpha TaxID=45954 RepID=A0A9D4N9S1_DREPO|nr:hypothetical protein DPMN_013370 [Dreissena polymorpha]
MKSVLELHFIAVIDTLIACAKTPTQNLVPPNYKKDYINECASSPCKNGATCNDNVSKFNCSCEAGFTGHFCETDIDECA